MNRHYFFKYTGVYCLTVSILFTAVPDCGAVETDKALKESGIKGGLVVHLGCGDPSTGSGQAGKLTADLRAGDSYLVHGLDTDAANIAKAREYIRSKGLYGPVSVATFDGKHLPYVDNLVNLLVADELGGVTMAEVMRVLAPLGVAYVKRSQPGAPTQVGMPQWAKTVKPWPKGIDEWSHHCHGPDGNPVAREAAEAVPVDLRPQIGARTRHGLQRQRPG